MKRLILVFLATAVALTARAQHADAPLHLSAGVSAGTTGLGVEASVLLPKEVGFRAGFNWLQAGIPIPVKLPEDFGGDGSAVGFQTQLTLTHGYLLTDLYPVPGGRFRLTGGIWAGSPVLARLYNTGPLPDAFNAIGIDVDGYSVRATDGNLSAELRVNAFKPYLGVGFGRLGDRRWNVSFDAGVLWWGNPGLFAMGYDLLDEAKEVQLTSAVLDGMDKGILDKAGHVLVYPMIRCIIHFRVF